MTVVSVDTLLVQYLMKPHPLSMASGFITAASRLGMDDYQINIPYL